MVPLLGFSKTDNLRYEQDIGQHLYASRCCPVHSTSGLECQFTYRVKGNWNALTITLILISKLKYNFSILL